MNYSTITIVTFIVINISFIIYLIAYYEVNKKRVNYVSSNRDDYDFTHVVTNTLYHIDKVNITFFSSIIIFLSFLLSILILEIVFFICSIAWPIVLLWLLVYGILMYIKNINSDIKDI